LPEFVIHNSICFDEYIRKSIQVMNNNLDKKEKEAKLIAASKYVREDSMIINSEFTQLEDDLESVLIDR